MHQPYAQGFYDSTGSGRYGGSTGSMNPVYGRQSSYGRQDSYGGGSYGGGGNYAGTPSYGGGYGQQPFGQPPPPNAYGAPPVNYTAASTRYGQGVGRIRPFFPPGTDPEAIAAFEAGDYDGSGFIDAAELSRVVSASVYVPFTLRTVNLMLHLFSASGNDKIAPAEFVALWKELKDWRGVFETYDRDRSGTIDQRELRDAFLHLGYAISNPLLQILISKYDRTGQSRALDYDNFIECGLVVKGLTDRFKAEDRHLTGSANLKFEKFMQIVLPFIVA